MKRILLIIGVVFLVLTVSHDADAQFLKKLADKVSESVGGDKGINSADDASVNAQNGQISPSRNNKVLPEDYTLKLTGSGPDLYLAYQMNLEGKQSSEYQMDIKMKMVASPATGMGRSEMVMNIPMLGEMRMVTLTNAAEPLHITLLNERKKQYAVIDLSEMDDAASNESYTITKLGEEKLHGLSCIHSKAVNKDGHAFELWTTTEVPGYEKVVALYSKSQQMGSGDLWKEMQEAGVAGFMVKLKVDTEGGTSVMKLTEIKNIEAPESIFQIPAAYEEKGGGWVKKFLKR